MVRGYIMKGVNKTFRVEVSLVKIGKLSEITGLKIWTIKRMVAQGQIRCFRVPGKPGLCYFNAKEVIKP